MVAMKLLTVLTLSLATFANATRCVEDACFKGMKSHSKSASSYCAQYTNASPKYRGPLPSFTPKCNSPSCVSSACSCVVPKSTLQKSTTKASSTPCTTTKKSTTSTKCKTTSSATTPKKTSCSSTSSGSKTGSSSTSRTAQSSSTSTTKTSSTVASSSASLSSSPSVSSSTSKSVQSSSTSSSAVVSSSTTSASSTSSSTSSIVSTSSASSSVSSSASSSASSSVSSSASASVSSTSTSSTSSSSSSSAASSSTQPPQPTCEVGTFDGITNGGFEDQPVGETSSYPWLFGDSNSTPEVAGSGPNSISHSGDYYVWMKAPNRDTPTSISQMLSGLDTTKEYLLKYYWTITDQQGIFDGSCYLITTLDGVSLDKLEIRRGTAFSYLEHKAVIKSDESSPTFRMTFTCGGSYFGGASIYLDDVSITEYCPSCKAVTPAPSGARCNVAGYDSTGYQYPSTGTPDSASVESCAKSCAAAADCKVFTYLNVNGGSRYCGLFSGTFAEIGFQETGGVKKYFDKACFTCGAPTQSTPLSSSSSSTSSAADPTDT